MTGWGRVYAPRGGTFPTLFIYHYIFICSKRKFNVDLYWITVSELIIYCKYACKFMVFELLVIYYIFLYYTFLPILSSLTYKTYERYNKPENLGFCYQPISMPNSIKRQCQRHIKNPVELLLWSSFTKNVNGRKVIN